MADPLIDDIRFAGRVCVTLRSPGLTSVPTSPRLRQKNGESSTRDDRRRTQRVQAAALVILATAAVLSLMYVAKLMLVVILTSVLMAFVLAPLVDALANFRIPALAWRFSGSLPCWSRRSRRSRICPMPEPWTSCRRCLSTRIRLQTHRGRNPAAGGAIRKERQKRYCRPEPDDKNSVTVRASATASVTSSDET